MRIKSDYAAIVASCCVLTLACAMAGGDAHAAVYKWVDESGVTHYSQKPPPGKKTQQVPIRTTPAPADADAPQGKQSAKTWQEQEAEFQQRRVEQEEQRMKKEALDRAGAGDRSRLCALARRDLRVLDEQRPVYWINDKGERVYVEDKDRDKARERMRQAVEQNCASK